MSAQTPQPIADWLEKLGLGQYAQRFTDNEIDVSVLRHLSDQDLKDIGVPLGHRRKILAAISEAAGKTAPADPAAEVASTPHDTAERRQVTVMFSDLVGSTALSARMDPEDLREVISAYQKCVSDSVKRFGGFVAKYLGDGVLIYFGYPQAHEDDPERAVRAGLALIDAVANLPRDEPLQTRVGIATGLVVVGDLIGSGEAQERGIAGETPNLAGRLQGIAEPNTVVIAENTRKLIGNLFGLQDLGVKDLKGISGPVQAWAALRASSVESRFEALRTSNTPLVGREEEVDLLLRRWEQAKWGDGAVVLISGEPGIGKSRIAQTVVEQIGSEPHTRLRYFCLPHHQDSALHPSIAQLERAAGFRREDMAEQRLAKLEAVLAQGTNDLAEAVPLFADLLSIPTDDRYPPLNFAPQKRKEKTLQAQVAQVEGLAARQPVLMMWEDVHWSDPTTRESLDLLIDRVVSLRALVILTFRPEFKPPWLGRPHVTMLNLNRLPPTHRAQMILYITGGKPLPREIADQIVDRTDGIPLFIEELTKSVVESGIVAETADHYTATRPTAPLAIPATLHASLTARLDRLAPTREVAQIGAALGRSFSHELISAVARMARTQLDNSLAQLVNAELIFQRGITPDAEYTFKHALVQDAAYDSLLKSKRAELHSRIAQVLEREFSDLTANNPEMLAHHFTQAGLNERAVPYWTRAGQRALERVALAEAVGHLKSALSVNDRLPKSVDREKKELQIRLLLASAYFALLGWAAVEVPRILNPARNLAISLGESEQLTSILYYLWIHHSMLCEYEMADAATAEMYSLAESTKDSRPLVIAQMMDTCARCWKGDFAGARQVNRKLAATYEPRAHGELVQAINHDPKCLAQSWAAPATWILGYPDEALSVVQEQLVQARQLGHVFNLIWALVGGGHTLMFRGETKLMLEWCAEARAIGQARAMTIVEQMIYPCWSGFALIRQGEYSGGHARCASGWGVWRDSGGVHLIPESTVILAQACLGLGQAEQAASLVRDAIALIERTGHRFYEAEAHRVRGEVLLSCNDLLGAETELLKAFEIAGSQQAKSWELRAATSLARLWRDQGKRTEARDLLAPVYSWFTEGFDTLDLKEAKALLEEIGA